RAPPNDTELSRPRAQQGELDEPGRSARWRTIRTVAAVAQWQSSRLVSGRSSVRSRPAAPTSRLAETVCSLSFLQRPAGLPLSAIGIKAFKRGCPMIRMMLAVLVRMVLVVIALAAGPVVHAGA